MRPILQIFLALAAVVCAAGVRAANPRLLLFAEPTRALGEVREADGKVRLVYEFENIAQESVVIVDVQSTCNCAVSEYDRKEVQPGGRGKVVVEFDPVDMNGDFKKHLTVIATNGTYRKFNTLTLEGNVVSSIPAIDRDYPALLSEELRCDREVLGMRLIAADGLSKIRTARIFNASDREVSLDASCNNDKIYVFMPRTIAPGQSAEIRVAVDGRIAPAGESFESALFILADGKRATPLLIRGAVANP